MSLIHLEERLVFLAKLRFEIVITQILKILAILYELHENLEIRICLRLEWIFEQKTNSTNSTIAGTVEKYFVVTAVTKKEKQRNMDSQMLKKCVTNVVYYWMVFLLFLNNNNNLLVLELQVNNKKQ